MPIGSEKNRVVDDSILKRNNAKQDGANNRWWLENDTEQLYRRIQDVTAAIHSNLSPRRRQNYMYSMMYNDIDTNLYASMAGNTLAERSTSENPSMNRITFNVIQNGIDTAAAMICKNRPEPMFLSDGSREWSDHVKAQQLTKYCKAVINECDIYNKMERVFTDGGIYGTGFLKLYPDFEEKKIKAEWCFIDEILIDDMEGFKEKPSQLHQRKWISKDQLIEDYPDFQEQIMQASAGMKGQLAHKTLADMIPVTESWHLKSGSNAKDGRHVICCETATLFHEPYDKDFYPFVVWRWYHQSAGYWGRGICQEVGKIQRVINKIARTIDQAQDLMAIPFILSPKTAMIADDHLLSNAMARLVEYYGDQPPSFMTPPAIQQELYQWIWALEQRAYNYIGVSQPMAEGHKDPDLKSGEAIRMATEFAASRLMVVGQRYEDAYIDIADKIVELSRELAEKDPELSVVFKDEGKIQEIKWKDIDLDRDRFNIHIYEVSGLSSDPAERIDQIMDYGAQGWLPKEVMMSLLKIPDLSSFTNLESGTYDMVRLIIGKIKETNQYDPDMKPIREMQLAMAFSVATMEKVLAKLQGLPEDVLNKIDLYIQDITQLQKEQAQAANPQPQVAPAAAPMGSAAQLPGMPPPQSPPQPPPQS